MCVRVLQLLLYVGGLELEGVEIRVHISDKGKDNVEVKDLIPKQV